MPAVAMTDHGNVFGAYEFYKKAKAAGVKPIIGIEAYFAPDISRVRAQGRQLLRRRPRRRQRPRRLHAHDAAQRVDRGDAQPLPAQHRRVAATASSSSRAWTASCSPSTPGHHRHDRLPVRRGAGAPAPRQLRRGPAGRRRLPGHPRPGQLLPRADGPRPRPRDPGPRRAAPAGQGPADPAAGHQRLPLRHARRTRRARSTCSASTPARRWTSRPATARASGSPSTATATTSSPRPRCASCGATCPRPATTPCSIAERCDVEFTEGNGTYMPRFPCPPGESEDSWLVKEVETRAGAPLPRRRHRRGPRARRLRDRRHPQDGLPRLLPGGRRLHQLGQGAGHPGRAGPRLGRRLDRRLRAADHRPRPAGPRAAVRAVPQPRAHLDARLRHRLRRASARRGDPLRHRQVRRRPGRDDRHLRHHQGQAGGQGLQPDPRLPVRDGRPDHQGDAGRGDGQGRPAQGGLRPRAQALRRGRRVPRRSTTPTPTSSGSSTPRWASRGSSASGACTRPA